MVREIDVYHLSCVTVVLKKWKKQIKKIKGMKKCNSAYVTAEWRWKGISVWEEEATKSHIKLVAYLHLRWVRE